MVSTEAKKEVDDILKETAIETKTQRDALDILKFISDFKRAVGQQDTAVEAVVSESEPQVKRFEEELKKRNIKV